VDRFVSACAERGFRSELVTNGARLNVATARNLATAGLNLLAVSLHSLDPAIYYNTVGIKLECALRGVEEAFAVLDGSSTAIAVWRVLPPPGASRSIHDAPRFDALKSRFRSLQILGPSEPWERDGQVPESSHGLVNDYPEVGIRCALLYFTMNVAWDGASVMCCVDFHRQTVPLGNIFRDGFDSALNRQRQLAKDGPVPPLCLSCRKWPDRQYDELFFTYIANCIDPTLQLAARPAVSP